MSDNAFVYAELNVYTNTQTIKLRLDQPDHPHATTPLLMNLNEQCTQDILSRNTYTPTYKQTVTCGDRRAHPMTVCIHQLVTHIRSCSLPLLLSVWACVWGLNGIWYAGPTSMIFDRSSRTHWDTHPPVPQKPCDKLSSVSPYSPLCHSTLSTTGAWVYVRISYSSKYALSAQHRNPNWSNNGQATRTAAA